ncbi:Anion/proton exchange transporter [Komagataella phaffii CBS 7435]|uniref:Chloride channel protein n=2 Tax=Komagataella phaffii TaxID=460519 RepID=C4R0S7_KOMPG|nr:uncharacterized protein PAS_chr2-1_0471 [Komagataella phaffii GS115]AOA62260.1 GQ67_00518T0 [Komagataella phaffii]CAH2448379.1 Anion/proton exchange transporter [Komagataella phaffii CBS 7435]AOA67094.1 GQ68_00870T0 [Komagataella phaffii GS115]CAY69101.1 Chloride channel localized to late-or post-Golgi vesicles, involved in iron metabolism [Komagataella phaffii GS115]CCA38505.1 Anion/proton exchange transporter [Komagataella phaffii CBS 7435]
MYWKNSENSRYLRSIARFDQFDTIDWINETLKSNQHRFSSWIIDWLCLASIGVFVGIIAGCLNIITEWLTSIKNGYCSTAWYLNREFCCMGLSHDDCPFWNPWPASYLLYIGWSVLFASIGAILVKTYSKTAAGSGISEIKIIVSGFDFKAFLNQATLFIKSLTLPLVIASGLSVGKEGPSVHYAACVGSVVPSVLFSKYFNGLAFNRRHFITAATAAGVGVAFGSPIGGVLFAIEEISNFPLLSTFWKCYFCALCATATLASIDPFRNGQLVLFQITYNQTWYSFEIPVFMLLGLFGGLYGIVVSKLNIKVVHFRNRFLIPHAIKEVVYLTLLTSLICYNNVFLKDEMTKTMQLLFKECSPDSHSLLCTNDNSHKSWLVLSLLVATLIRSVLVIISYGCKVPAGIFVPSMAVGATFGRSVGLIMEILYASRETSWLFASCPKDGSSCITGGSYALIGAASALSGITHLTVTVVIVMFELTGAVNYIIPIMIAIAVTKTINDRYGAGGIADQMIKFNGMPFIDSKEEHEFFQDNATHKAMTLETVYFPLRLSYHDLEVILADTDYKAYPVLDQEGFCSGLVQREQLVAEIGRLKGQDRLQLETMCMFSEDSSTNPFIEDLQDSETCYLDHLIKRDPVSVMTSTPLEISLDIFVKLGPRLILVKNSGGKLAGLLSRKDIIKYENYLHSTTHSIDENEQILLDEEQNYIEDRVWSFFCLIGSKFPKIGRKEYEPLETPNTR